jgi:hypothetical protein
VKYEVEHKEIKEYKTMNGRQVPVYKITRYTKEQVEAANREAARLMEEELGKPSSPTEILKILKGHAEEVTGEKVEPKVIVEDRPKLVER